MLEAAVLAEGLAVVGNEDDDGPVLKAQLVQPGHRIAETGVCMPDARVIEIHGAGLAGGREKTAEALRRVIRRLAGTGQHAVVRLHGVDIGKEGPVAILLEKTGNSRAGGSPVVAIQKMRGIESPVQPRCLTRIEILHE